MKQAADPAGKPEGISLSLKSEALYALARLARIVIGRWRGTRSPRRPLLSWTVVVCACQGLGLLRRRNWSERVFTATCNWLPPQELNRKVRSLVSSFDVSTPFSVIFYGGGCSGDGYEVMHQKGALSFKTEAAKRAHIEQAKKLFRLIDLQGYCWALLKEASALPKEHRRTRQDAVRRTCFLILVLHALSCTSPDDMVVSAWL